MEISLWWYDLVDTTTLAAWGGPIASDPDTELPVTTMNFALSLAGPVSPNFSPVLPVQQCQDYVQGTGVVVQVLDNNGDPINLRSATLLEILLVKPSGTRIVAPATFFTNGLDGQMFFSTSLTVPANTGIDQVGTWSIQGKIILAGATQFTSVGFFEVFSNLGA
jgi:hypothetical protein